MVATPSARASELGLPSTAELWALLERFNVEALHQRYPTWRSTGGPGSGER